MHFLDRLKIKAKLGLLLGLSALALAASILLAANLMHQRMIDDRIAKLHGITEVAIGIAQALDDEVKAGKITQEEALARLRTAVYGMWYDNHHDYVIAFTLDGVTIANPNAHDQQGTSRLATKDPNGKPIVGSMIDVLKNADEGLTDYVYPKPGTTEPLPKLTYIKKFAPWNAFFATGVWTDDIEAEYRAALVRLSLLRCRHPGGGRRDHLVRQPQHHAVAGQPQDQDGAARQRRPRGGDRRGVAQRRDRRHGEDGERLQGECHGDAAAGGGAGGGQGSGRAGEAALARRAGGALRGAGARHRRCGGARRR